MPKPKKKTTGKKLPFRTTVKLQFADGSAFEAVLRAGLQFDPESQTFETTLVYRSEDNSKEINNQMLVAVGHAFPESLKKGGK